TEVAQLDHFCCTRIELFQLGQRLIQREKARVKCRDSPAIRIQKRELDDIASPLLALRPPRMVHEYPPQLLGSDGEEMLAILPLDHAGAENAEVGLVEQGRRL